MPGPHHPACCTTAVRYTDDQANRLETVTDWAGRVTTYHDDANGRLERIDQPGDISHATWTYNAQGDLKSLGDVAPLPPSADPTDPTLQPETVIRVVTLGYDALGNLDTTLTPSQTPVATRDVSMRGRATPWRRSMG